MVSDAMSSHGEYAMEQTSLILRYLWLKPRFLPSIEMIPEQKWKQSLNDQIQIIWFKQLTRLLMM